MQKLKKKIDELGITARECSKRIGVTESALSMWLSGKRFPRKDTLDKLCKFFDCKIDDLL